MLALCQHNTLAYYASYYAGIFDTGLAARILKFLWDNAPRKLISQ